MSSPAAEGYRELCALYRRLSILLAGPRPEIPELERLMAQAAALLGALPEAGPEHDPEAVAAAREAQALQRTVNEGLLQARDRIAEAAAGLHRGSTSLQAYGGGGRQQGARYVDRRH